MTSRRYIAKRIGIQFSCANKTAKCIHIYRRTSSATGYTRAWCDVDLRAYNPKLVYLSSAICIWLCEHKGPRAETKRFGCYIHDASRTYIALGRAGVVRPRERKFDVHTRKAQLRETEKNRSGAGLCKNEEDIIRVSENRDNNSVVLWIKNKA